VAYASRAGSTAEIAEVIGQVLRDGGLEVDVRPVQQVADLEEYDALVLGSAVWVGKPLPEAVKLATAQQARLDSMPVAYFLACGQLEKDTPEMRAVARGYLAPLEQIREPIFVGLFAGKRDFGVIHPLLRWFFMRIMRISEGDWRNWEQIRAWAAELGSRLREAGAERTEEGAETETRSPVAAG
jgi:menaquinone-dependent protoporphyrinogen oxidase